MMDFERKKSPFTGDYNNKVVTALSILADVFLDNLNKRDGFNHSTAALFVHLTLTIIDKSMLEKASSHPNIKDGKFAI